jgi:histidinol-phosphate/aromatic aminotransferase/cobyric acid decarboxylase-like protein
VEPARFTPQTDERRSAWLQQFFTPLENEENTEATTFDGSLPQALAMMNGELVRQATSGKPDTYLSEVLRSPDGEVEKIRRLSLATLSRYPTPDELDAIREALRQNVRAQTSRNVSAPAAVNEGLRDVFWAYLNASEFIVNH